AQEKTPPIGRRFSFPGTAKSQRPVSSQVETPDWGSAGVRQRYEEATMRRSRPTDPTDPGDAADLSIMGYSWKVPKRFPRPRHPFPVPARTLAQRPPKINVFLTTRLKT